MNTSTRTLTGADLAQWIRGHRLAPRRAAERLGTDSSIVRAWTRRTAEPLPADLAAALLNELADDVQELYEEHLDRWLERESC